MSDSRKPKVSKSPVSLVVASCCQKGYRVRYLYSTPPPADWKRRVTTALGYQILSKYRADSYDSIVNHPFEL